jgi:hypothetical protein
VRIIGELIVVLGLAAAAMGYVMRKHVGPALRRKHIAELERENRELDEQIARFRGDHRESGGTPP